MDGIKLDLLLISMHPCFCVDMTVSSEDSHTHTQPVQNTGFWSMRKRLSWTGSLFTSSTMILVQDSKRRSYGGDKTNYVRPHFGKKIKMVPRSQCCLPAERESRTSPTLEEPGTYIYRWHIPSGAPNIAVLFMQQAFSPEREKQSAWAVLLCHQLRCRI